MHGWVRQLDVSPSTRRWSVEVYVSQDSHQGTTVVFGYIEKSCEHYDPNIYIGAYTHKYLGHEVFTTGSGPHTTLDLTHVRNSLGRMTY